MSKFPNVGRRHTRTVHEPRQHGRFPQTGRVHSSAKPQRPSERSAVGVGRHMGTGVKIPGQPVERSNWMTGRAHETAPPQRKAVHVAVGRPLRPPVALELKLAIGNAEELDAATAQHDVAQHHLMAGMRETGTASKPMRRGLPK